MYFLRDFGSTGQLKQMVAMARCRWTRHGCWRGCARWWSASAGAPSVVAERVRWPDGSFVTESGGKDAFGHAQLGGAGPTSIHRSGFGITAACRRYLAPLIQGEALPPFGRDGLPKLVKASRVLVPRKLPAYRF